MCKVNLLYPREIHSLRKVISHALLSYGVADVQKGDNCDFSRSRVYNTSKQYQSINLPKHMVFCPFPQKRGYCKKESRCDFRHNSTLSIYYKSPTS